MWWWRKVRKANISEELRTKFERFGQDVLAQALAVGAQRTQGVELLELLQGDRTPIMEWLTERRDIHERKEDRLETVEWLILIFVIVGVLADILILVHELR